MEVQPTAARSVFFPILSFVKMATDAAPLVAIIITTVIAMPIAEMTSSKQMKSVMAIAPPLATTPIVAPSTLSTVRPIPAMPFALISISRLAPVRTAAVLRGAIASTIMIVAPFAKIIWLRKENIATGIAKRVARTATPVPLIHRQEVPPPVISNALILLFRPVPTTMNVVRAAAIPSPITTANLFVATLYLK